MPAKNRRFKASRVQQKRNTLESKSVVSSSVPECKKEFSHDQVRAIFQRLDVDGNGTIDQHELALVLNVLSPGTWTEAAVSRLFNGIDINEDGRLSIEEFLEWIFGEDGGGSHSFKGALELAETPAADVAVRWAGQAAKSSNKVDLLGDLERIRGADIAKEIQTLPLHELQILRMVPVVPEPVRRTLEAVYLLLLPSHGHGATSLSPPSWAGIQRCIGDASFLQRIQNFSARRAELRRSVIIAGYVADVYFHAAPSEPFDPPPLTYDHVVKASQLEFGLTDGKASAVVLLYRWCLALLEPELLHLHARDHKAAEEDGTCRSRGPLDDS